MTTPEQKAKKALAMKLYRQKLKEKNPEAFLEKQRLDKAKQRQKIKENTIFEIPYVEPKKSVKIKVIKKGPPLPATLPPDIDETPPPLPTSKSRCLTYKTKNIMKEIKRN